MKNALLSRLFVRRSLKETYLKEETKRHTLLRYVILVLFIIAYFLYESRKLGTANGFLVTILTWSFFVFCTPIADAGFVLAFPIRLLVKVRMIYTQIVSFGIALVIVLLALAYRPAIYHTSLILKLFHTILLNPYPYWFIIVLSLIGTLFSIYFGDELMDVSHYKERQKYHRHLNKYRIVVAAFMIVLTIGLYSFLLNKIGIHIPLM